MRTQSGMGFIFCAAVALTVPACGVGELGADDSLCAQAVDHLSSCGITAEGPDACDAEQQELATDVLGQECTELTDRSTFMGSTGCPTNKAKCWAKYKKNPPKPAKKVKERPSDRHACEYYGHGPCEK